MLLLIALVLLLELTALVLVLVTLVLVLVLVTLMLVLLALVLVLDALVLVLVVRGAEVVVRIVVEITELERETSEEVLALESEDRREVPVAVLEDGIRLALEERAFCADAQAKSPKTKALSSILSSRMNVKRVTVGELEELKT